LIIPRVEQGSTDWLRDYETVTLFASCNLSWQLMFEIAVMIDF
jgi:hypothetical protein